jgi:hypothetical protein
MQLSQQSDELLVNMFNSSSVEKHKVKYLGPFADIFFPLGKLAARTLCLGMQVLEETQKSSVFDVGGLNLQKTLYFFQIIINFLWLLQIVLVAGFKYTSFALLVVEEP